MRSADEVRSLILSAFNPVPIPSPDAIPCAATVRDAIAGRHWQDLEPAFLTEHAIGFGWLGPEGYQHYLPALLLASLNALPENDGIVHSTLYGLAPAYNNIEDGGVDRVFEQRSSLFTTGQFHAVAAFLGLFIAGNSNRHTTFMAARALKWGWDRAGSPERSEMLAFWEKMQLWDPTPHAPLPKYAALAAEIESAFAATPRPASTIFAGPHDDEGAEGGLDVGASAWQNLHPDLLAENYTLMGYLNADSFRYYLPAFLMAELRGLDHDSNASPLFYLTHGFYKEKPYSPEDDLAFHAKFNIPFPPGLTPEKWVEMRLASEKQQAAVDHTANATQTMSRFNRAERLAIMHYLEYHANEFEDEDARQALNNYWLPSVG